MIRSSWFPFHEEVVKAKHYLKKNLYPARFDDKQVKTFLKNEMNGKIITVNITNNVVKCYELPDVDHISTDAKGKLNTFCKFYCKNFNIRVVLTPFKFGDKFNVKDPIPMSLKSFMVYRFVCQGCNARYISEKTRDLATRIKKYLETYKKTDLFAHQVNNENCKALSTENCFEIIDFAFYSI